MKGIVTVICFGLITVLGFSQTLTLEIGPSFSSLDWTNSNSGDQVFKDNLTGLSACLNLEYLDFRYFNLSSGLGFIQKGGTGSLLGTYLIGPEGVMETDVTTRLNYLSFNTLFKAKLPLGKVITPFIQTGPRLDYLVSWEESFNIISQFSGYDELTRYTYGAVTGAGIDFSIRRVVLGAVFNYFWNFNKIVDYTSDSGITNQISDQTFMLNARIGYKFQ